MKKPATFLLALVATLALRGENILDDDAFWNKDTAYVEPAVETATRLLDSGPFEFATAWDLILTFAMNFNGNVPKGTTIIVR